MTSMSWEYCITSFEFPIDSRWFFTDNRIPIEFPLDSRSCGGFPQTGVPPNVWFIVEKELYKWDDLGALFQQFLFHWVTLIIFIIHVRLGCSTLNQPFFGYPHGYGNLH